MIGSHTIDIDDIIMKLKYDRNKTAFNRTGVRMSILINLTKITKFSTTGNFNSDALPFFFFTPKVNTEKGIHGTSLRLTFQAYPLSNLHEESIPLEICCIRGIPDNAHAASTILGLIFHDLYLNFGPQDLKPIFITKRSTRNKTNEQIIFAEELFLSITTDHQGQLESLQPLLNLKNIQFRTAYYLGKAK
jgi:hypothetical protein